MVDYRLGKYIRLSQADVDLSRKEGKTESDSIAHQRDLINRFIDSRPEFAGCPQSEFLMMDTVAPILTGLPLRNCWRKSKPARLTA